MRPSLPISGRRTASWHRRLLACCCGLLLLTLTLLQSADWQQQDAALYPPPRLLVNLSRFRFLLNTDACGSEPVRVVLMVHSDPRHPEDRHSVRRSMPDLLLRRLGVRRLFMLADAAPGSDSRQPVVSQSDIIKEHEDHQDLVQGDFIDSYHNLTYKHIMALDWAATYCPQATWIVKMDDDTMFDIFRLLEFLPRLPHSGFLGGNKHLKSKPFRGKTKWSVSHDEWPHDYYPSYLSGGLYIVTPDVAKQLVLQSRVQPFFWIDDVYVTGILASWLLIDITALNNIFVAEERCADDWVSQEISLEKQSSVDILSPSFVVYITPKNFTTLEHFNLLVRYCFLYPCKRRERRPKCSNSLAVKRQK